MTGSFLPLIADYVPRVPFWHRSQRDCFDRSFDKKVFGIGHEPRTGKSCIVTNTCRYHFQKGNLRGAVIVAWPNGAHHGWVLDAFPEAWGRAGMYWDGFHWDADDADSKENRRRFANLLKQDKFAVLAVGADSLRSERAQRDIVDFITARGAVLATADESTFMVEWKAERTQIMHRLGRLPQVKMRRILDGTPCDSAGPLDFYSQMGFLDWKILGYPNEVEYRAHYAVIETKGRAPFWAKVREEVEGGVRKRYPHLDSHDVHLEASERLKDPRVKEWAIKRAKKGEINDAGVVRMVKHGRDWWTEIATDPEGMPRFQNMDEFHERLDPHWDRATFAECFPDAPRPVYSKIEFELSPLQREAYDALESEHSFELDGERIEVAHHLSRMLRLQQIVSNYMPERGKVELHDRCGGMGCEACDDSGIVESREPLKAIDPRRNVRLEVLSSTLDHRPTIIWARFKQDVDSIMEMLKAKGLKACQYDGRVSRKQKLANRLGFQNGAFDYIVGNPAAASRAIPLHRADRHIMYSNIFSFRTRRQQEERAEHGRKTTSTQIDDMVALRTVDDLSILPALRTGMDVSTYVLRDAKRDWI